MGALLSQITTEPVIKPPMMMFHGKPGVGKTSFAASIEGVLFMLLEDGLGLHKVPHLPQPESVEDVLAALHELAAEDHGYKAIAIDTIDHLEPLVWEKVCRDGGKDGIEDFGYGKGYIKADAVWQEFFRALVALQNKGMVVVILAHDEMKVIDDPQVGSYVKVVPKLHKRANAILKELPDIIGYLDTERVAVDQGEAGRRTTHTSSSTGQRVLYLEDTGAFEAKNHYDLPTMIHIPKQNPYQALRVELVKAMGLDKKQKEAA